MKIIVLSLKSADERRRYISSELKKYGLDFSFFDALSPDDIDKDLFIDKPDMFSREAVATFESHKKIIESVKDYDEPVLILEDDAKIDVKNFIQKVKSLLETDLEYDMMFLGWRVNYLWDKIDKEYTILNNDFIKLNRFIELHSYIVNKSSVDKILDLLNSVKPHEHVDFVIADFIKENKIKGIFSQEKIFIQNKRKFKTQIPKKIHIENKNKKRFFQIGFNKCGTTTLHNFFKKNGLRSLHWRGGRLATDIKKNYDNKLPLLSGYERYDCFTDMEFAERGIFIYLDYYKELDKEYPDSVFILNVRNVDDWIKSRLEHPNYLLNYMNYTGLNENEVVELWRNDWFRHIEQVKEYFKDSDRFICFDITYEQDKFLNFISKFMKVRYNEFGHFNKSSERKNKRR